MGRVLHLFRAPKKRVPMEELRAHARPDGGRRQVLLVDIETLRAMQITPGIIRENITTEGLDVNALPVGQKVRVGEVEWEVSTVCKPCELMEQIRAALMSALMGAGECCAA
jgi:MOSC domain-containing protein YiiM